MKPTWLKFWSDPAYFTGVVRATVGVLAGAVLTGKIAFENPTLEGWVWTLAQFWPIILAKPAGQTNSGTAPGNP